MANEVGSVSYGVQLGADNSDLVKSIERVISAFERLEKNINQVSSRAEKQFSNIGKAAATSGDKVQDSFDKSTRAITPTIGKLEDLQASYNKIRREADRVGNTDGFEKVDRAMKAYKTQADAGFESTSHMREATTRLSQEMGAVAKETQQYERVMIQMEKSIGGAEREVAMLTARMEAFGASEEEINPLNEALKQYKQDLEAAGGETREVVRAQETYKTSIAEVKNEMESKRKSIRGASGDNSEFIKQMQNSTKAVQLALGPLSGIAARITAFTALVRTNTVSIAAFTASITGLVVATNRIINVGIEYERQLLSLDAAISATGRSAETTVSEIDDMSRAIAAATLTSSTQARQALNILMSMSNVAVDMMEEITITAQGMSSVMGGNLVSTSRMLGRALEQPSSSLDSLRRVGIQFTETQKDLIRNFEATGQVARAQGVILDRTRSFYQSAQEEAQGLAGQLDAVGDNFQTLLETISQSIGTNERLAEVYQQVNNAILGLIENQERISNLISGVSSIVIVAGKAIEAFANNLEIVAAILTGLFAGAVAKALVLLARMVAGFRASAAAAGAAATSYRLALAALGPMGIAIGVAASSYLALTGAMGGNERQTNRVREAHEALAGPSDNARKSMEALGEATGKTSEAMVKHARLVEQDFASRQKAALRGLQGEFVGFFDEIENAALDSYDSLQDTITLAISGISDSFSRMNVENATDAINLLEEEIKSLEEAGRSQSAAELRQRVASIRAVRANADEHWKFQNAAEAAYETVRDGGVLSQQQLANLRTEAVELGVSLEQIDRLGELSNLNRGLRDAQQTARGMARALREGTVDLPILFENLNREFGDLIFNADAFAERSLVKMQAEILNTKNNAMEMYDELFRSTRLDLANAFAAGEMGAKEYLDAVEGVINQQEAAADSARNLEQAYNDMRLEGVADSFRNAARTMALNAAETDAAREALEKLHNTQDQVNSLLGELSSLTGPEELALGLEKANEQMVKHGQAALFSSEMIDALNNSQMTTVEALKEIEGLLNNVGSAFVSTSSKGKSEAEKLANQFESLKASLDPVFAANNEYRKAQEILNKALEDGEEKTRLLTLAEERREEALRNIKTPIQNFKKLTGEMVKELEHELATMDMLTDQISEAETTREVYQIAIDNNIEIEGKHAEAIQKVIDKIVALKKEIQDEQNIQDAMASLGLPNPSEINKQFDEWIKSAERQGQIDLVNILIGQQKKEMEDAIKDLTTGLMAGDVGEIGLQFQQREFMLAEQFGRESEEFKQHLRDLEMTVAQSNIFEALNDHANSYMSTMNEVSSRMANMINGFASFAQSSVSTTDAVVNTMGGLLDTMSAMGREQTKEFQILALAQAAIHQALAVAKVFADPTVPTWVAPAMAAAAATSVGAQIAAIQSQSFSTGGFVSGKGTSTSDSIPARLSDGEFVMRASAVDKYGVGFFDSLNKGNVGGMKEGGMIGTPPIINNNNNNGAVVNVEIIDQSTGQKEYTTEETMSPDGIRNLKIMVRDVVRENIYNGQLDRDMAQNYGSKRKGKKR